MVWLVALAICLGLLYGRHRLRKSRRNDGSDALTEALGLRRPYKGPKWSTGDKPWL